MLVGFRFKVFALVPALLAGCGAAAFAGSDGTPGTITGAAILFAVNLQLGYLSGAAARHVPCWPWLERAEREARPPVLLTDPCVGQGAEGNCATRAAVR